MSKSPLVTFVWMPLLCLCAIGLTIAAMLTFVVPEPPDARHAAEWRPPAFWAEMAAMCLAEVVFFAYLAYVMAARVTPEGPSRDVRNRILAMVVLWMLVVLVSGSFAVHYPNTFFGDKIVFLQLIVTFVLFLLVFLFHRQAMAVESAQVVPQQERAALVAYASGVEQLLGTLRALSGSREAFAADLDRLAKRMDTLKTQLASASPMAQREQGRAFDPVSVAEIENRLRALRDQVRRLEQTQDESFGQKLAAVRQTVDDLIAAIRQREDVLTF